MPTAARCRWLPRGSRIPTALAATTTCWSRAPARVQLRAGRGRAGCACSRRTRRRRSAGWRRSTPWLQPLRRASSLTGDAGGGKPELTVQVVIATPEIEAAVRKAAEEVPVTLTAVALRRSPRTRRPASPAPSDPACVAVVLGNRRGRRRARPRPCRTRTRQPTRALASTTDRHGDPAGSVTTGSRGCGFTVGYFPARSSATAPTLGKATSRGMGSCPRRRTACGPASSTTRSPASTTRPTATLGSLRAPRRADPQQGCPASSWTSIPSAVHWTRPPISVAAHAHRRRG